MLGIVSCFCWGVQSSVFLPNFLLCSTETCGTVFLNSNGLCDSLPFVGHEIPVDESLGGYGVCPSKSLLFTCYLPRPSMTSWYWVQGLAQFVNFRLRPRSAYAMLFQLQCAHHRSVTINQESEIERQPYFLWWSK